MTRPLYIIAIACVIISFCKDKTKTKQALLKGLRSFENIMPQMLFILLLIGFILSVLTPDQISALLGSQSGWFGTAGAICLGAVTLIPPYVSYPLAEHLLQNGAGIMQVSGFISSLTTVGIVTLSMEKTYLGRKTAYLRNALFFAYSFLHAALMGVILK
ncbi:MAG: hypothetical protein ACOYBC_02375 [Bilifractor sp.]|jgi:uncharacterized membrane protein YraQ (UPF0718 family)